ncbi:MAG: ornithine carbamoyltransferase [Acidobacteriota bacterium]|nr:ornithine carbamoyltransferase [Acidobacteriota bacterium]
MMCSKLLKHKPEQKQGRFYQASERGFQAVIDFYARTLQFVLRFQGTTLLVAVATLALTVFLFIVIPKGFFPIQDAGVIQGVSEAAQSISFPEMSNEQQQLSKIILQDPDVDNLSSFIGVDGTNTTLNSGRILINLKPLSVRKSSASDVIRRLQPKLAQRLTFLSMQARGGAAWPCFVLPNVLLFIQLNKHSLGSSPMAAPVRKFAQPIAKHLLSDLDLSVEALRELLDLAGQMKRAPTRFAKTLAGRYLSLLFEKPSLRTRLTFELAIKQLGGDAVNYAGPIGEREPVKDVARNLERWTQGIVARVFAQSTIEELAKWSHVPVINALSDRYHPCQILADMLTLQERFGKIEGLKLAFVGDGNNVAHSLMLTAGRLGIEVAIATPPGYGPDAGIVAQASEMGSITVTEDVAEALDGADAVYTDVWTSMGQEAESAERQRAFAPYQVNAELFARAKPEAIFLHCLPAKRGEEVTDQVMESPRSAVFDQAENRLHAQKALLAMLLR